MSSTINIVFDNVTDVMNDTTASNGVVANVTSSDEREEEVYYQKSMEFIFEVVLLLAVGILGLIGNISAIVLFARLENQLKFHRLMMTLSAFDTLYVIVSILLFALPQLSKVYIDCGAHQYILPKALPFAQVRFVKYGADWAVVVAQLDAWN